MAGAIRPVLESLPLVRKAHRNLAWPGPPVEKHYGSTVPAFARRRGKKGLDWPRAAQFDAEPWRRPTPPMPCCLDFSILLSVRTTGGEV